MMRTAPIVHLKLTWFMIQRTVSVHGIVVISLDSLLYSYLFGTDCEQGCVDAATEAFENSYYGCMSALGC